MASESTEDLLQITSQPEAVVYTCDQQEPAGSFLTGLLQKFRFFKHRHMAALQSIDDDSVMSKILQQFGFHRDKEDKGFLQNVDDILTILYAIQSANANPRIANGTFVRLLDEMHDQVHNYWFVNYPDIKAARKNGAATGRMVFWGAVDKGIEIKLVVAFFEVPTTKWKGLKRGEFNRLPKWERLYATFVRNATKAAKQARYEMAEMQTYGVGKRTERFSLQLW